MARPSYQNRATLYAGVLMSLAIAGGCGKTEVVTVDGSSTVFLISAAVAENLHESRPDVNVVVSQSGTGGGFKKFVAREIDICDASRAISEEEKEACEVAGIDYLEFVVAFDGLAVVVNPTNDWCDKLTVDQLRMIWRKESQDVVNSWSDVNPAWPDIELKLYGPGTDSGTYDYFNEVINGDPKNSRQDYSPDENDNALVTGVAGDEGSLGYFGLGYYIENQDKLKLLAIDGGDGPVKPTVETVRNGGYQPLSRPLYIYVRKDALHKRAVREYLKYYLAHANDVAEGVGYVPVPDEIVAENRATLGKALDEGEPAA
ncbi:MAG TPA: PstS family phosphate ABC transporter substrate-binding protein [Lacipirellula sp.]